MLTGAWSNKALQQIVRERIRTVEPDRRVCDVLRVVTEDDVFGMFPQHAVLLALRMRRRLSYNPMSQWCVET